MKKFKILYIDDENSVRKLLQFLLKSDGYDAIEAKNGSEGLMMASSHKPDVIILDLALPDMSGEIVLKLLREWSKAPVIVLTANKDDDAKVKLLDLGADDYLVKPFHGPELLARIRVAIRHIEHDQEEPVIKIGDLIIDLPANIVRIKDNEIKLTITEFRFLKILVTNLGRIVTQGQILNEIWGPGNEGNTHYLRIYVAQLRKKIEKPLGKKIIYTESAVGYRIIYN